ncbi:SURF1 family protein [Psychrosphaera haliotis]|nr:SURF1 family protein [Psychrosphaera haliotis]
MHILKRFTFTPWSLVITVTAFLILCKLGFWQLERADQKRILLEQTSGIVLSQQNLLESITLGDVSELNNKEVTLELTLDNRSIWLIDNKIYQGQAGYDVVVPALVSSSVTYTNDDGSVSNGDTSVTNDDSFVGKSDSSGSNSTVNDGNAYVFVNLGWWKAPATRAELPEVILPEKVNVTGLLKTTDLEQFTLSDKTGEYSFPQRVQSVNAILEFHKKKAPSSSPVFLYASSNTINQHPQLYKPVVMPPEKHVAYAVQWFLLAVAAVIVFLFASLRSGSSKTKRNNNEV